MTYTLKACLAAAVLPTWIAWSAWFDMMKLAGAATHGPERAQRDE